MDVDCYMVLLYVLFVGEKNEKNFGLCMGHLTVCGSHVGGNGPRAFLFVHFQFCSLEVVFYSVNELLQSFLKTLNNFPLHLTIA
jgi:hypothetical protein